MLTPGRTTSSADAIHCANGPASPSTEPESAPCRASRATRLRARRARAGPEPVLFRAARFEQHERQKPQRCRPDAAERRQQPRNSSVVSVSGAVAFAGRPEPGTSAPRARSPRMRPTPPPRFAARRSWSLAFDLGTSRAHERLEIVEQLVIPLTDGLRPGTTAAARQTRRRLRARSGGPPSRAPIRTAARVSRGRVQKRPAALLPPQHALPVQPVKRRHQRGIGDVGKIRLQIAHRRDGRSLPQRFQYAPLERAKPGRLVRVHRSGEP